ncbi:MAG: helix-turn-helix domain-containing protein [Polyangiaceae bacterium]
MNGADYVREALSIIEARLMDEAKSTGTEPLCHLKASDLAARIGYSVQHFARLFRSLTGESPADYIQKRRLTEAARRILVDATSIATVARNAGWADYETFSRAFKRHFGVSPSRARSTTDLPLRFCEPFNPANLASHVTVEDKAVASPGIPGRLSEPQICEEGERYLVGLPFFMDYGVKSFHRPWAIFERALKSTPDKVPSRIRPERFCQFTSWLEDDETNGLFILCALEVDRPSEDGRLSSTVNPPFMWRRLPPCRYLVFTHFGGLANLAESYRHIYGEALAASDFLPSSPWEQQRYLPSGDIEIAIPIARS